MYGNGKYGGYACRGSLTIKASSGTLQVQPQLKQFLNPHRQVSLTVRRTSGHRLLGVVAQCSLLATRSSSTSISTIQYHTAHFQQLFIIFFILLRDNYVYQRQRLRTRSPRAT